MTRRQQILVIAGLAISVIFLLAAFSGLNPAAVLDSIRSADLPLIVIAAAWYLVSIVIIAARWGFLLRAIKPVPLMNLVQLVFIGYMGNNVYPLRAGEILRIVLLQRNNSVPMARATTVIIIERVFDGLVMLTLIIVSLGFVNIASPEINAMLTVATPLFLIALVAFFVLAARPNLLRKLAEVLTRILPAKLRDITLHLTEEVIAGLEAFRTPVDLIGAIITSFASWMLGAISYMIVASAFGFEINYGTALLLVGVINLAGLIPASPGQLGVFEFLTRLVLVAVGIGVSESVATAYALTIHLVIWLPATLIGFFYLARMGLGWAAIARARELEQKPV
jgi:uncharacterized protein (TIRG00374 family)